MATKYMWQRSDWPELTWNDSKLITTLAKTRHHQGSVQSQFRGFDLKPFSEFIVLDAVNTAAIEGEIYDPDTVRSSVARRLGLPTAGLSSEQKNVDGLVEVLLDATTHFKSDLTKEKILGWHAGLFPTGHSGIHKITVANWRKGDEDMKVISGAMGKEKIHYIAPPSKVLESEMKKFLTWWKSEKSKMDGIIRAGVAHFWFVTIHPFDDGNGRIARAITDLALAQDENTGLRLYSLSSQILKKRKEYYEILETCQKGDCDITTWLQWFLQLFDDSLKAAETIHKKIKTISEISEKIESGDLNVRQKKVMANILEAEPEGFGGGINNKKYVSMTKASPETAKRDLKDLIAKGFLKRNPGGGRSTSYSLKKD